MWLFCDCITLQLQWFLSQKHPELVWVAETEMATAKLLKLRLYKLAGGIRDALLKQQYAFFVFSQKVRLSVEVRLVDGCSEFLGRHLRSHRDVCSNVLVWQQGHVLKRDWYWMIFAALVEICVSSKSPGWKLKKLEVMFSWALMPKVLKKIKFLNQSSFKTLLKKPFNWGFFGLKCFALTKKSGEFISSSLWL